MTHRPDNRMETKFCSPGLRLRGGLQFFIVGLSAGRTLSMNINGRPVRHGLSKSNIYAVWRAMFQRCYNPKNKNFKYYGARGIQVCERWGTFELWMEDMGERPTGGTIERINNDGNYEPLNCKWATMEEQNLNKRPRGSFNSFVI